MRVRNFRFCVMKLSFILRIEYWIFFDENIYEGVCKFCDAATVTYKINIKKGYYKMADCKTYGLTHLAIAVNDVERTMKFYQQVFDMQTMYHKDGFIQLTTPGCKDILVFEEKKDKPILNAPKQAA